METDLKEATDFLVIENRLNGPKTKEIKVFVCPIIQRVCHFCRNRVRTKTGAL